MDVDLAKADLVLDFNAFDMHVKKDSIMMTKRKNVAPAPTTANSALVHKVKNATVKMVNVLYKDAKKDITSITKTMYV